MEVELRRERIPLALPLAFGVNETLKTTCCPAERVSGRAGPLTLKPNPTSAAWETVTADCPELPRTRDWTALLPTWTLLKFTLDGLTASCPLAAAAKRRMLNRTDPLTWNGKLTGLKASPLAPCYRCAVGGFRQLHPSTTRSARQVSRLRPVKGAAF